MLINKLKKKISYKSFIEPSLKDLNLAKKLNADCVEIHTGKLCNLINKKKIIKMSSKGFKKQFTKVKLGLEVHAGHGLTYNSAKILSKIKEFKSLTLVIF